MFAGKVDWVCCTKGNYRGNAKVSQKVVSAILIHTSHSNELSSLNPAPVKESRISSSTGQQCRSVAYGCFGKSSLERT